MIFFLLFNFLKNLDKVAAGIVVLWWTKLINNSGAHFSAICQFLCEKFHFGYLRCGWENQSYACMCMHCVCNVTKQSGWLNAFCDAQFTRESLNIVVSNPFDLYNWGCIFSWSIYTLNIKKSHIVFGIKQTWRKTLTSILLLKYGKLPPDFRWALFASG